MNTPKAGELLYKESSMQKREEGIQMIAANEKNKAEDARETVALRRFGMIAPLLTDSMDHAAKINLREEIAKRENISIRTLYRYEKSYAGGGFSALKPSVPKRNSSKLPPHYDELVEQAIQLKREIPKRSVSQIITILELEGRVAPGLLKRSTLERHLYNAGFGVRQMKMYSDARESSSKRFCKPHRMMLIQGDIKYGPMLPIGKNGALVQTYLSSAIDDHSRYLLHSRFYDNQEETIVEDTFRSAICKYGAFDACYFDNGSQYVAKQLKLSLSRLGIAIRHAPVRSGKSKGKQEKFHQVVDSFLRECRLKSIKTLDELNRLWEIFLDEYYHKKPHEGIREYYESLGVTLPEEGISPQTEFNRDSRKLKFLDVSVVSEAFLHHEERLVDKGACISFRGMKYETRPALIGCRVQISYDPQNPETITIIYNDVPPFEAKPLCIGEYCDKTPSLPLSMQPVKTDTSRFLDALEKKHEETIKRQTDAISFSSLRKASKKDISIGGEVNGNV